MFVIYLPVNILRRAISTYTLLLLIYGTTLRLPTSSREYYLLPVVVLAIPYDTSLSTVSMYGMVLSQSIDC